MLVPEPRRFEGRLRSEIRPDILLTYYCLQILKPPLLDVCDRCVNYHNRTLPAYRGIKVTCWSVYNEDDETGVTFHHLSPGIDEGNVLIAGAIPIHPTDGSLRLESSKLEMAAGRIPHLLDLLAAHDSGEAQTSVARYYSKSESCKLLHIDDPASLSGAELCRRVCAFQQIRINIKREAHWVISFKASPESGPAGRFTFRSADGIALKLNGIQYLRRGYTGAYAPLSKS